MLDYVTRHAACRPLFDVMAAPSLLALPLAGLTLLLALLGHLRHQPINRLWLMMSVATLAGTAAKDELKFLFGRPWPSTWLLYGQYSWHPLANGSLYGSFPSGHTTYIAAPLFVLYILAPQYRLVAGSVIAIVMLGLVGAGYHFVSDTIGGLLTGLACAAGTIVMMRGR